VGAPNSAYTLSLFARVDWGDRRAQAPHGRYKTEELPEGVDHSQKASLAETSLIKTHTWVDALRSTERVGELLGLALLTVFALARIAATPVPESDR
jgi:hypothetical protein